MADSAEARLLLASLAWAAGRGAELAPSARRVRRWPRVLGLAGRRGIAETLAHAFDASGAGAELPAHVHGRLRAALELGTARNLVLLSEAARVQAVLSSRGIPSVALKGTALVAAHYPAPGARHVSDLDLLVPAALISEAAAALAHEGPRARARVDHHGRPTGADCHLDPSETAGGVACELHFRLPGHEDPGVAERVLEGARTVAVPGGGALRIPAPAECAAIACVHAFAGHQGSARYLPRLVADLEVLEATGGLDWGAILRLAGPERADAVEQGRRLLERARAGDAGAVFPAWSRILAHELAPLVRAARDDARALFPTKRFMARRYGVPERSARLFLYYLARPFLAVRARLRG